MGEQHELKPCPFCGGSNIRDESYWIASPVEYFGKYACNDCEAEGPLSEYKYDTRGEAQADAANQWNTRPAPAVAVRPLEAVKDALAGALGDAYDCTRVWEAWSYGTMGPDDFTEIACDDERLTEISDAILSALSPQPPVTTGKTGDLLEDAAIHAMQNPIAAITPEQAASVLLESGEHVRPHVLTAASREFGPLLPSSAGAVVGAALRAIAGGGHE